MPTRPHVGHAPRSGAPRSPSPSGQMSLVISASPRHREQTATLAIQYLLDPVRAALDDHDPLRSSHPAMIDPENQKIEVTSAQLAQAGRRARPLGHWRQPGLLERLRKRALPEISEP